MRYVQKAVWLSLLAFLMGSPVRVLAEEAPSSLSTEGVNGNSISISCTPEAQSVFAKQKKNTKLDWDFAGINDACLGALLTDLESQTHLGVTEISLVNNSITDQGLQQLLPFVLAQGLLRVSLGLNQCGVVCGSLLGALLQEDSPLAELFLEDNPLGNEGITELMKGLTQNTHLQKLSLKNTAFDMMAAFSIGNALAHNTSLIELNLSYNSLGDAGIRRLLSGLRHNTTLKILNVSYVQMSSRGAKTFQETLQKGSSLEVINIAGNSISQESIQALQKFGIQVISDQ